MAPESMVLTGDKVTKTLDAFFTTVKFGLTGSYNGLDYGPTKATQEGYFDTSNGKITYSPDPSATSDEVLDDLSLLLTSGRLGPMNRGIIMAAFENEYVNGDKAKAVRIAQQLITATPEFHTTSLARKGGTAREISSYADPPTNPYKAVSTSLAR